MRAALLGVRDPQSGDTFGIVRCLQCQLGMTLPVIGPLSMANRARVVGSLPIETTGWRM